MHTYFLERQHPSKSISPVGRFAFLSGLKSGFSIPGQRIMFSNVDITNTIFNEKSSQKLFSTTGPKHGLECA